MKHVFKLAVIVALLGVACSTSKITSVWKAQNVQPREYSKILVLGLINEPDRTIREKMEANLVAELKTHGYDAVCSCDEYGPKEFENMKEEEALNKLGRGGIDAVLTIVLLDKQKERYYVPEGVYYSPYAIYHNRFWGYYTTMYGRVYAADYYAPVTDTKYFWESNFYSINHGQELLYSVQSRSFNPGTINALSNEYSQMIVKSMVKNGILSEQRQQLKPM
jgi:hypothetical protein